MFPTLSPCNPTMICNVVPILGKGVPEGLEGDQGTCIPTSGAVMECFGKLSDPSCACPIDLTQDCRYQLSIIDVYIENKTDQRLHLSSCKLLPVTVQSFFEEEEEEVRPSAFSIAPHHSGPPAIPELIAEWVTNPISVAPVIGPPPNIIEIGDIAFMRAAVSCYRNCCKTEKTFSVQLDYTIGVKAKKLGLVSVTVVRIKQPATKEKCGLECQNGHLRTEVWLNQGFGSLSKTGPSITPKTQVYGASGTITSSQFVMKVFGGNVVNGGGGCTGSGRGSCEIDQLCVNNMCMKGCTGDSGCPPGQVCSNNLCVSSTDGLPTKKLLIIITVSVTAFVLVIGFLYFLITISKSRKKTS